MLHDTLRYLSITKKRSHVIIIPLRDHTTLHSTVAVCHTIFYFHTITTHNTTLLSLPYFTFTPLHIALHHHTIALCDTTRHYIHYCTLSLPNINIPHYFYITLPSHYVIQRSLPNATLPRQCPSILGHTVASQD